MSSLINEANRIYIEVWKFNFSNAGEAGDLLNSTAIIEDNAGVSKLTSE